MKKSLKRFSVIFLIMLMMVSMLAVPAMAAGSDGEGSEEAGELGETIEPAEGEEGEGEGEGESGGTLVEPSEGESAEGEELGEEVGGEPAEGEEAGEELGEAVGGEPAEEPSGVYVTVLHTNDVHCAIDNYPKVAGYRDALKDEGKNVVLLDAGDHVQGGAIGSLTKGEEIITIMSGAGYDLAIPGNHEFDYQMSQFIKNVEDATYPYVSSNFRTVGGEAVAGMKSYVIKEFEGKKIAFVGITTPETFTSSTPAYFQDENGNWLYTFSENTAANPNRFYPTIQKAIDDAKEEADAVVVVGHTGMLSSREIWDSQNIIANTTGIDLYIDGHSHETIPGPDYLGTIFTDLNGKAVPYVQTGTQLANLGECVIHIADDGTVTVETGLKPMEEIEVISEKVQELVDAANGKLADHLNEILGRTEAELTIFNADGEREVRKGETNMGDFNADAFRYVTGAEIALVNSGGVRKSIPEGEFTREQLINVNPFGNEVIKVEATGQQILDALEHGVRNYPNEFGGFLQVSGLRYEINKHIDSPVILDENGQFASVDESKPRRVQNVMVGGEPIDPEKKYTVGGTSYLLQQSGDGMTMLASSPVLEDNYPNDSESLELFVTEKLKGVVPAAEYGDISGQGRIKFVDEHVYGAPEEIKDKDGNLLALVAHCLGHTKNEEGEVVPCEETVAFAPEVPEEEQPTGEQPGKEETPKEEQKPAEETKPDTKTETKPETKTETKPTGTSGKPKTGDEANTGLYLAIFAGGAVGATVLYKKRKNDAA